jgi:hypothetical protein
MRITSMILLLGTPAIALPLTSCDDDGQSEDSEKSGLAEYKGRGSEACQAWQYSICEYLFDTCNLGNGTRAQCEQQYGSMVCLSDQTATTCAEAFQNADCTSPPLACDFDTVVDPQPAIDGCNAVIEAECARWLDCDMTDTVESCREEMSGTYNCDDAMGLAPWYEECLEKIDNRGCADLPPEGCDGLILAA